MSPRAKPQELYAAFIEQAEALLALEAEQYRGRALSCRVTCPGWIVTEDALGAKFIEVCPNCTRPEYSPRFDTNIEAMAYVLRSVFLVAGCSDSQCHACRCALAGMNVANMSHGVFEE